MAGRDGGNGCTRACLVDGQHHHAASLGVRAHQAATQFNQRQALAQRQHATGDTGGKFAHAVTDDIIGAHAARGPEPCLRKLHHEDGRLCQLGGIELAGTGLRVEQPGQQRVTAQRGEQRVAFIKGLPVHRFLRIQRLRHARVLAALAGVGEHHGRGRVAAGVHAHFGGHGLACSIGLQALH